MFAIKRCDLPAQALHKRYAAEGAYVDSYTTVLRGAISHAHFVETFYTTIVFKLERLVLFLLLAKRSTDGEARKLANGELDRFSAWSVEARAENQLLMCDFQSRTRSWLMVALEDWDGDIVTRLYFGSVVVPETDRVTGKRELGAVFKILMPFHRLYSRLLLTIARHDLKKAAWR